MARPTNSDPIARLTAQIEGESAEGMRLLQSPDDNPICDVFYDAQIPCVSITWKRYATSAQLRFIAENVVQLIERHGADKFLADVTGLPNVEADDQVWIVKDWMPRAAAAGLKVIAGKNPASSVGKLSADHIVALAPGALNICFFDDRAAARAWLKTVRPF